MKTTTSTQVKTVREWFSQLPPHLEAAALSGAVKDHLDRKEKSLHEAIWCSIIFDATPPNEKFWYALCDELESPVPDLTGFENQLAGS